MRYLKVVFCQFGIGFLGRGMSFITDSSRNLVFYPSVVIIIDTIIHYYFTTKIVYHEKLAVDQENGVIHGNLQKLSIVF